VVVVLLPGWRLKLVALLLWLALLIGRKTLLRAARRRFLDGEVSTLVAPKLDAAAVRIAELLDVRYVVFGHSHKPMIRQVRDEPPGWYVNLGAWLPPRYRERHEGGCRSSLTFAQLLDRRVPELQLLRWCQRNDRPETFLAHLPAEADVPEETQLRTEQPPVAAAGASAPHSALPARRRLGKPAGRPSRESLRKQRY
jgi:hypothetical protein